MTIAQALQQAQEHLVDLQHPRLDAEVLLQLATQQDKVWLLTHSQEELNQEQEQLFRALLKRRAKHEPLAYLRGYQEFYGRKFLVNPSVLIPRPETELFLDLIKIHYSQDRTLNIIDLGTGSGCLAITLALEFPKANVIGLDISEAALQVAQRNAQALHASVTFIENDLLEKIEGTFDIIAANLPYLDQKDIDDSATKESLAFEPQQALLAVDQGFALMKKASQQSAPLLKPEGRLYLEMLPTQTNELRTWIKQVNLPYLGSIHKDLSGKDRILELQKLAFDES